MKSKTLLILAVITAVVVGLAVLTQRKGPHDQTPAEQGKKLLDGLTGQLNNAASFTIKKGKDETTIARKGDTWVLVSKNDYPAEFEKVKEAIVALADLKVVEAKTANPEFYSKLGVADPAPDNTTSKLLTVKDTSGNVLAALIVGNMGQASGQTVTYFARKPADTQSWLVEGRLTAEADPLSWVKRDMLSLEKDRIKSVTVTQAPGPTSAPDAHAETLRIFRDTQADPQFLVENKPPDRELKSPTAADQLANGLSYLTFEDVRPATQIDFDAPAPAPEEKKEEKKEDKPAENPDEPPPPTPTLTGPVSAEFRTFDGLIITARLATKDGKTWALFQAEADPASAQPEKKPDAPDAKPEDKKPPAAPLKTADEVKKEADDLNKRLSAWAFSLPEYRAKQIASRMTDMLKDPAPPAPPPGPAGPQLPGAAQPGQPDGPGPVPAPK